MTQAALSNASIAGSANAKLSYYTSATLKNYVFGEVYRYLSRDLKIFIASLQLYYALQDTASHFAVTGASILHSIQNQQNLVNYYLILNKSSKQISYLFA